MDSKKQLKRNILMFPVGTIGRDMVYALWTNFIMLFILYTQNLTPAQLAAVAGIMFVSRVFDALNDPIMGNIIERTRSRWGKFKPWLLIGILTTSLVVYLVFSTNLKGWSFIGLFGVCYFLYSITFTMHDIAYYGMIPALSSDGDTRNLITARTTLCAGIGSTLAGMLIPLFTAGDLALGGSTKIAYSRIALVICILSPLFLMVTLLGVRENRDDMEKAAPPVSFKKIISTIAGNDQLVWVSIVFLISQIGNGIVLGGAGSNYIYFEFGYEGGLYSTFSTIGLMATAVLMVFYPMIAGKMGRKPLVKLMTVIAVIGYGIMLLAGIFMPASMLKFWIMTIGFMGANLGQYGFYLVLMISIINTVEYNEYKHGSRDEAIISSMRPYLTKLCSAVVVMITTVIYLICNITSYTNRIASIEQAAELGNLPSAVRSDMIAEVIADVGRGQTIGLLLAMTALPLILLLIGVWLYMKKYTLDEDVYEEICKKLNK